MDPEKKQPSAALTDRFAACVRHLCNRWAQLIVRHSVAIIVVCSVLTLVCVTKTSLTPRNNSVKGYAPYGARSLQEFAVRDEFFDQTGPGVRLFVLLVPRNGTNILTENRLREAVQVDDVIQHNFTIFNRDFKKNQTFGEVCRRTCKANLPVRLFYTGLRTQTRRLHEDGSLNENINLSYPDSELYGHRFNIQPNFFGIRFCNEARANEASNSSKDACRMSNMHFARMVVLLYRAERLHGWTDEELRNYEMRVSRYFEREYHGELLKVMTVSVTYADLEIERSGRVMMPYAVLGLVVMMVCASTTVAISSVYMRQFTWYKMLLTVLGCLCPFMASGTALGLLFFFGVRYASILAICPFLILATGVDDVFLTIHEWQRQSSNPDAVRQPKDIIARRLSMVIREVGVSVIISAMTNILSDTVGSFTGSPEITLLCIGNIACVIVDFVYQVTLFVAILVIIGEKELDGCGKKAILEGGSKPTDQDPTFHDKVQRVFSAFLERYLSIVTNSWFSIVLCFSWIVFLVLCVQAVMKFEINLTTSKLFPRDSPLLEIENYRENEVLPLYTLAELYVNNPGNLSDRVRRHRLDELVEEMESLPGAYGRESTRYFLRDYDTYMAAQSELTDDEGDIVDASELPELARFLNSSDNDWWQGFLKWHSDGNKTKIDSFLVTVAYHGDDLKDWAKRAEVLTTWREVVDRYIDDFNVSVLHSDGLFLDLLQNMPTDMWQSAVATLACMALMCATFMLPNFSAILVATLVIASVLLSMFGIMALQKMTMDPIVMASA